jgi:hypothetical protein
MTDPIPLKENGELHRDTFATFTLPNGATIEFSYLMQYHHGTLEMGIGYDCQMNGERAMRDAQYIDIQHLLTKTGCK